MSSRSNIRHAVEKTNDSDNLLEMILDLGRVPTARFVDREIILRESEITRDEIDYVDERIGSFDADNRAGHRAHAAPHLRHPQPAGRDRWLNSARGSCRLWHGRYHSRHHRVGQVRSHPRSPRRGQDDPAA